MAFSDLHFLYLFLPIAIAVYYFMPDLRRKNLVLMAAGLLFYTLGQPHFLPVILFLAYLNWQLGFRIEVGAMKTLLIPIAANAGFLLLTHMVDPVMMAMGREANLVMPVGIAFFTLTVISYHGDIYHGKIRPEKSFQDFLFFVTLLPRLPQGPILRYDQAIRQIRGRKTNLRLAFDGVLRFSIGLSKKVLLADACARLIASMEGNGDSVLVGAWLTAILFMMRIYFECSGFADMAIGLGKIFGFRLPEDYDLPYTAGSVSEFLARWHMTFVGFLGDYVQKPLEDGHNNGSRQIGAIFAACMIAALWHGVTPNFLILGGYLFLLCFGEKLIAEYVQDLPYILRNFLTMLLVLFGFVIFRQSDPNGLKDTMKAMFGFSGFAVTGIGETVWNSIPVLIGCAVGASSIPRRIGHFWSGLCGMKTKQGRSETITVWKVAYVAVVFVFIGLQLWLCTMVLVKYPNVPSIFGML